MERRSSPSYRRRNVEEARAMEPDDTPDSESEVQESDDEAIDDDVPPATVAYKTKRRANSVIDSAGAIEIVEPTGYVTPRRTIGEPADEVSPDQGYPPTPDPSESLRPQWATRRADAVDAMGAQCASDDDGYENIRERQRDVSLPVGMDELCYNMNHPNRGKCIVFNHETFDMSFDKREGSTADALRIHKTFTNLGFTVEILDDYCHADVIAKIKSLSEEDHSDSDCICIFVLTHGLSNDLISAKDVVYTSEKIWKPFTADNCTTLAGKPKLFFFQACRGAELDRGVVLRRSKDRTETDSSIASYKIPTHSDFVIGHSTVQGFYSWRSPEEGTWYIQCLCEVIDKHWRTTDLLTMMTITSRKVATECASYDDVVPSRNDNKQVPSITSMLIRDVYFTPK